MDDFLSALNSLGIKPQNLNLYETAFTHRSFLNETKEPVESNERLEFLGDSVLSFIISSHLYRSRTRDQEGELTNLRSYIIKTESLAQSSKKLNLGSYLKLSRGEEMSGGRENTQLLANTYEAVLGAIYLDLGIEKAEQFVHKTLVPLFQSEIKSGPPKDAKSQLQELVQEMTKTSPRYKVLQTFGPDHAKQFKIGVFLNGEQVGEGEGPNKQHAEEEAAKQALARLTKHRS